MGFWSSLFRSDSGSSGSVRVRENSGDRDKVRGDKYEHSSDGHTHRSYDLSRSTGRYKEYSGGEKSGDRSYNKKR
jgi:hypothetical protein